MKLKMNKVPCKECGRYINWLWMQLGWHICKVNDNGGVTNKTTMFE